MTKKAFWDKMLADIELTLNTAPNQTTGVSPFNALYGYEAVSQDGLLDTLTNQTPVYQQPVKIKEELRAKIAQNQAQWKTQHDKKHKETVLSTGDIVFLRRPSVSTGTSTKLQLKY